MLKCIVALPASPDEQLRMSGEFVNFTSPVSLNVSLPDASSDFSLVPPSVNIPVPSSIVPSLWAYPPTHPMFGDIDIAVPDSRLQKIRNSKIRSDINNLGQLQFNKAPWETKRYQWIALAKAVAPVVGFLLDANRGFGIWYEFLDNAALIAQAEAALQNFCDAMSRMIAAEAGEFSEILSGNKSQAPLKVDDFCSYLRFRAFIQFMDRQSGITDYFLWKGSPGIKSFADLVSLNLTQSRQDRFVSVENARLRDFLLLPHNDLSVKKPLSPHWQALQGKMQEIMSEPSVTAYFSPAEIFAFRQKIFAWGLDQDNIATRIWNIFSALGDPAIQARFLKILVYTPSTTDLRFLVDTLSRYSHHFANLDDFLSKLAGDYTQLYERGDATFGTHFEIAVLRAFENKGPGVEVIRLGEYLSTRLAGINQEVDLRVRVKNPNDPNLSGDILIEAFHGPGYHADEKGRQLDHYVSAALRHGAGVAYLNNDNYAVTQDPPPRYVKSEYKHPIWNLGLKQINHMTPEQLQQVLWRIYEDFWARHPQKQNGQQRH